MSWWRTRSKRAEIERAYAEHGHSVLRRAQRILNDASAAEEVLQDVFSSLLARPEQFEGRSAVLTWLYSATTHRCLNILRDEKNRARLLKNNVVPLEPHASAPSADARVEVLELLAAMPDELAQVAVYYYLVEMTQAEIAEVLGCSRRHVGHLLERFRVRVEKRASS